MLTRSATAARRAEGLCMTPSCSFYQVPHGNGKCSGCANRLSPVAPDSRSAIIVADVLSSLGITTPASDVAMHVLLPLRGGVMARQTMLALINAYKILLGCGESFLLSTEQGRRLFEEVRDRGIHAETTNEMTSLHGVILSFCATPWEFYKDMDSGLVDRTAMCYWGHFGEPVTSKEAYLGITNNRVLALRGRSSIDRPL